MARGSRVEIWQGQNGKWYFHKRSPSGRITEASQGYTLRRTARKAAQRDIPGVQLVIRSSPPD